MRRQGKRPDTTSRPVGEKLSVEKVSELSGDSSRQIHRFIRLTDLIKPILDMVDEGRIALRPAVEISYLPTDEQETLLNVMEEQQATPSTSQAQKIRQLSADGHLTEDSLYVILSEEKPNQREKYSFQREKLRRYIPDNLPESKVESYIIEALEFYQRSQQRKMAARKNDAR